MKDKRNPRCAAGEVLRFEDSPYEYIITGELGHGGTSVVYDGDYMNHTGAKRPVRIREIKLKNEGERQQVRDVFDLNNRLFETAGLTNRIVNTYEIHETENFAYIVTTYQEGVTLDRFEPENLREALGAVRGLAHTLELLHDAGYLYLDVKPENVLVLEGGTDWVQLFDFDSVVRTEPLIDKIDCSKKTNKYCRADEIPVSGGSGDSMPFRFTPEFAAYEQKIGDVKHIGPWTDVYGVGAVLLYLLCGHAPDVFDSDEDAEYDMSRWQTGGHVYRDGLYSQITELLHRTLARAYGDRYQSMHELVDALDKLYADADETRVYVKSSAFSAAENIIGRNTELDILSTWLDRENSPCIYVTGMGGIGKSTIVRKFIADRRDEMDVIIYLSFADSVAETVCDDDRFYINTVSRQSGEKLQDYFQRKMRKLRDYLTEDNKICIVVIDNYEHGCEEELEMLTDAGCRLIIVTRDERIPECCDHLRVDVFADRMDMYRLMMQNMGTVRSDKAECCSVRDASCEGDLTDSDIYRKLDILIDSVQGHTLMMMVISRQIRRGYMTIDAACEMVSDLGFTALDDVKTVCTRDGRNIYGHMTDMIRQLFGMDNLTNVQRGILMLLSLAGAEGIGVHDLEKIIVGAINVLNEVNELIDCGWVECYSETLKDYRDERFAVHPVIARAARQEIAGRLEKRNRASRDLNLLCDGLRCLADVISEGEPGDGHLELPGSTHRFMIYGMMAADSCLLVDGLRTTDEYLGLAVRLVVRIGIDNEDFILRHGKMIIEQKCRKSPDDVAISDEELVEAADRMAHIHADRGEWENAEDVLAFLENWSAEKEPYFKGLVCDVRLDYIDCLLDGCFEPESETEKELYSRQMNVLNSAIELYDQADFSLAKTKLAADLIVRATYMIRSGSCESAISKKMMRRDVVKVLNRAKLVMDEVDSAEYDARGAGSIADVTGQIAHRQKCRINNDRNRHAYFMAEAWFYTYIEPDIQKAKHSLHRAYKVYSAICESELDMINYFMIPAANIYFELGDSGKCAMWLGRALRVCEKNEDMAAFARKKAELKEIIEYEGL